MNDERNAKILELVKTGISYKEVAIQLNVSRNTVAGVVSRAKEKVRDEEIRKLKEARKAGNESEGNLPEV